MVTEDKMPLNLAVLPCLCVKQREGVRVFVMLCEVRKERCDVGRAVQGPLARMCVGMGGKDILHHHIHIMLKTRT